MVEKQKKEAHQSIISYHYLLVQSFTGVVCLCFLFGDTSTPICPRDSEKTDHSHSLFYLQPLLFFCIIWQIVKENHTDIILSIILNSFSFNLNKNLCYPVRIHKITIFIIDLNEMMGIRFCKGNGILVFRYSFAKYRIFFLSFVLDFISSERRYLVSFEPKLSMCTS